MYKRQSQNDGSVLKFVGIVIHVKEGLNLESAMQNSGKYDAYLSIVDEVQTLKTIVESSGSIQEVIVARGEYERDVYKRQHSLSAPETLSKLSSPRVARISPKSKELLSANTMYG